MTEIRSAARCTLHAAGRALRAARYALHAARFTLQAARRLKRVACSLKRKRAFTLLELLIAVSIITIAGSTALALFSKGVDVWEDVRFRGPLEYNTVLFLEEIEKELKNQINFSEIQFSAESGTISFPALVRNRVGCIKYSFDKDKMAIYKYRAPYPECNREERLTPYRILDSVKSLSFEYSVSGREGLPGAVRIKIEVAADEKSNESYKFEKVVYIPAA